MDATERPNLEGNWNGRPVADWSPTLVEECQRIGGAAFQPNLNVYATLAHHPRALVAWITLGRAVVSHSGLDPADRERVILWVTSRCGGRYPFARHVLLARAAGLSSDEIQQIADHPSARWPTAMQDTPERVAPLVGFYSAASFMLERLGTPPDHDVVSEWPAWSRRSRRRLGVGDINDGRASSSNEARRALTGLVSVLADDRQLDASEWNGIVHVARREFGHDNSAAVVLDCPVDLDSAIVKWVVDEFDGEQLRPPLLTPRRAVESVLLAAVSGILGA